MNRGSGRGMRSGRHVFDRATITINFTTKLRYPLLCSTNECFRPSRRCSNLPKRAATRVERQNGPKKRQKLFPAFREGAQANASGMDERGQEQSLSGSCRTASSCATLLLVSLLFAVPRKNVIEVVHACEGKHEAAQRRTARNQAGNRNRSGSGPEPLQCRELFFLSAGALHQQGNIHGGRLSPTAEKLRAPAAAEVSPFRLHGEGRGVSSAQDPACRFFKFRASARSGLEALRTSH